jgi:plastocyanin
VDVDSRKRIRSPQGPRIWRHALEYPDTPGPPVAIEIVDGGYEPDEVLISAGTTVVFTNTGKQPHNVHWGDGTGASPDLATGGTYQRTLETSGTYRYMCGLHPLMTGAVVVGD